MSLSAVIKNASCVMPIRLSRWPKSSSANTGKRLSTTICFITCHRANCPGLIQVLHPENLKNILLENAGCRPCSADKRTVTLFQWWARLHNAGNRPGVFPSSAYLPFTSSARPCGQPAQPLFKYGCFLQQGSEKKSGCQIPSWYTKRHKPLRNHTQRSAYLGLIW